MNEHIKLLFPYEKTNMASSLSPGQKSDWGREFVNLTTIHTASKGAGVTVAIVDTGADLDHPDLQANIIGNFNPYKKEDAVDRNGHGTHVAGIVAAIDNAIGTIGIAPEARLLIAKGMDDNGFGDWNKIVASIQWAVNNGADIINMSLGDMNDPGNMVHDVIKWATEKGVIIVAAAGNDSNSSPARQTRLPVTYPARYDEVIAVGALDTTGTLAFFSQRDAAMDAAAPGVNIYSCWKNAEYATITGSSQASPIISGIIALLKSKAPESIKNYKDALRAISDISSDTDDDVIVKLTGNVNIAVPKFGNACIQSLDDVTSQLEVHKAQAFDNFDWIWDEGELVSRQLGEIYD